MRNKAMAEEEKPKTAENGTIAAAVTDEEAAEAIRRTVRAAGMEQPAANPAGAGLWRCWGRRMRASLR